MFSGTREAALGAEMMGPSSSFQLLQVPMAFTAPCCSVGNAGRPVAAMHIALHAAHRTREECVSVLLPALRRTAARIEADLRTDTRFTRVPLT